MSQGMASSDQVMVTAGRNTSIKRQLGHEEGWGNPKQAPWLPLLLMDPCPELLQVWNSLQKVKLAEAGARQT